MCHMKRGKSHKVPTEILNKAGLCFDHPLKPHSNSTYLPLSRLKGGPSCISMYFIKSPLSDIMWSKSINGVSRVNVDQDGRSRCGWVPLSEASLGPLFCTSDQLSPSHRKLARWKDSYRHLVWGRWTRSKSMIRFSQLHGNWDEEGSSMRREKRIMSFVHVSSAWKGSNSSKSEWHSNRS